MRFLNHLFQNNQSWAAARIAEDPEFFARLTHQQSPEYLWIGCSDSRVPANEIVGLAPGELFVHRNVANVVVHTDLNCLSTIQYAVDHLEVKHVIVCGHYGCGGVKAALLDQRNGLVDNWLRHVQDVQERHHDQIAALPTEDAKHDRLCELNVIEQVVNVCQTTVVREAWSRGQPLAIHSWIYRLSDGILHDLGVCVTGTEDLVARYNAAAKPPTSYLPSSPAAAPKSR